MAEIIPPEEQSNFETFRECLSEPVLRALATPIEEPKKKKKRHGKKNSKNGIKSDEPRQKPETPAQNGEETNDAEDLGEFIDYIASLIFPSLPASLRTLTYSKFKDSSQLQDLYSTPLSAKTTSNLLSTLPPDACDSLSSYALLPLEPDTNDLHHFFTPILSAYTASTTSPPPIWSSTRASACELCQRSWIPLTYHHLIPKSTHERVLKRGWHTEDKLNSVAWLCRACHSFVHRVAGNEELAKSFWSIELLEEREDVKAWVKWVGRVRWKAR